MYLTYCNKFVLLYINNFLHVGSNELLLKEQRLQQSLDKLNNRLRGSGQGGVKQSSFGSVMNKVCF